MFSLRLRPAEPGSIWYQILSRFPACVGRKGISSIDNFPVRIYVEPLHNFHHC